MPWKCFAARQSRWLDLSSLLTHISLCSEHDLGEDIYDCVPCEDEGDDIYEDIIKVEVQQPMVSTPTLPLLKEPEPSLGSCLRTDPGASRPPPPPRAPLQCPSSPVGTL